MFHAAAPAGLAVPVRAAGNLRRSAIVSALFGIAALVLLSLIGHPLAGVFVLVGLGLGAVNTLLVQRSVVHFGESSAANKKKRFISGVFARLGLMTLVALAIIFFVRPDGLGVLAGLALFQLVMLGGAAAPLLRELRNQ